MSINVRYDAEEGDPKAGWHTPNSIIVGDIVPTWRRTGGGVTKLSDSLEEAIENAISYTKQRITEAESHIRKLEALLQDKES